MNATNTIQGNLALKLETPEEPTSLRLFRGLPGIQPFDRKTRSQSAEL